MVRMLISDSRRYPKLAQFISNTLPGVVDRDDVWGAFIEWSTLSDYSARAAVSPDSDQSPLLRIDDLSARNHNGEFRTRTPDWIFLDQRLVELHEANHDDSATQLWLESTTLHEMVHWGYHQNPSRTYNPNIERGKEFETKAYGIDITMPEIFADADRDTDVI